MAPKSSAPKRKTARKAKRKTAGKSRRKRNARHFPWFRLAFTLLLLVAAYVAYLDFQVYRQFEGKRWALPARVYARPLELYAGLPLAAESFARELKTIGYRFVTAAQRPGEVSRAGDVFHLWTRGFSFWDGQESAQSLWLHFDGQQLQRISRRRDGPGLDLLRLDPLQIGTIHPSRHEDRVLVQRKAVPELLVRALVAVEDRDFEQHHGISFRGIARALWVNVRAGGVVQGGSTLTQQLVKNFLLTSRRSLGRKLNEALMAVLVERRYSKDEILEAYINEVYLAQDGNRAIHGFGLASVHWFDRPLQELASHQIALLVAMVKGPSYYDPRRHPERARQRRDLVLELMAEQGILSQPQLAAAQRQPLRIVQRQRQVSNWVPAFMDLLRRQLRRDYQEEDLQSEGLRIFTTLDPHIQWALEQSLAEQGAQLERRQGMEKDSLEGAGLVTSVGGEVLALAGGREPRAAGFNRVLQARRPVGSLLKPAVFLTALERSGEYSLATPLSDAPLRYERPGEETWAPQNYDHQFHGDVLLVDALAQSYNVATARLGLQLGLGPVIDSLQRLGLERSLRPYPSLLLGAVELSPWEVTELYQSFASGGFRTPLRAIREVMAADGASLQRYPLEVEAVMTPEAAYLMSVALQRAVAQGTARSLVQRLPPGLAVAGKTGTTDDLRDSWFAGYSADRLAVIWLGRDDNQPMGLSGSAGALQVWGDLFSLIPTQSLDPLPSERVEWHWVDGSSGLLADENCAGAVRLPFVRGSEPQTAAPCRRAPAQRPMRWLEEIFR